MKRRFARFSSLYQLKKAVAWILRLRGKLLKHKVNVCPLTVNELSCAQTAIIKAAQREFFPNEVSFLDSTAKTKGKFKFSASLRKLNPICISGVIRVGGRLKRIPIEYEAKHPIILPSNSHVTRFINEQQPTSSRHWTLWYVVHLNLTSATIWMVKGAITVRKVLGQCLLCKHRNATLLSNLWLICLLV